MCENDEKHSGCLAWKDSPKKLKPVDLCLDIRRRSFVKPASCEIIEG
jgi:hypothetical protein